MGWDVWSVGRHNLRLGDVKDLAEQLSERLDINIEYGRWDESSWRPEGQIIRTPGDVLFTLDDVSEDWDVPRYYLESKDDDRDAQKKPFYMIDIWGECIDISLWSVPGRMQYFWSYFGDEGEPGEMEYLEKFRRETKEIYGKLGADCVYYFSDQGPTQLIADNEDLPWEELVKYIHEGRCYDEYHDTDAEFWKQDTRIINVPEFLTSENPVKSQKYSDVFFDDFKDIEPDNESEQKP